MNWERGCAEEFRENWVVFHVTCINIYWNWDQGHDLTLLKRDFMLALYEQRYGPGTQTA